MKRTYVFSICLCIVIGAGVGWIAGHARMQAKQAGEQAIHSFCSAIQSNGGLFDLTFRTASPLDGQVIYLELDGEPFAEVEIPNSGSWTNFVDAVAENVLIPAGSGIECRITYDRSLMLFSSLSFTKIEG